MASTKGEKMIQAPTLLETWASFYAHIVRTHEVVPCPSLMRDRLTAVAFRVFFALRVQRTSV